MTNVRLNHILDFHRCSRSDTGNKYEIGLFANVVPYGDGYVGATRCGSINFDDKINVVNYDSEFNLLNQKEVTGGEDPRCFIYNDIPYALTWSPFTKGSETHLSYKVINLLDNKVTTLSVDKVSEESLHWQKLGKNWMPIVKNGILYFIITLEPELHIVRCDLNSGICYWETPYDTNTDYIPVTDSRGGTPFLFNEKFGFYFGIGHRTYDGNNHSPYLYTISENFKDVYIGGDIESKYGAVNDPLSLFQDVNGEFYCCITNLNTASRSSTMTFTSLYKVEFEGE